MNRTRCTTGGIDDIDRYFRTPTSERTRMTIDSSFVESITELADSHDDRALVDALPSREDSLSVHRVPDRDHEVVLDLERYLDEPRRPRGNTTVHDPKDFAAYVGRVRGPFTTVWADQSIRKVTAVLNDAVDHTDGIEGHGWRDHTVTLELQVDPEWKAWTDLDGKFLTQAAMVEHLEAFGLNVVRPDAATMLDLATQLRATRSAEFESAYRDKTGDLVVKYEQTTRFHKGEKGEIEVPDRIAVELAPYLGFPKVTLDGAFLVRVAGQDDPNPGRMTLGFRFVRPDLKLREAFDEVRNTIVGDLSDDVPVYLGAAPRAVTPTGSH